LIGNKGTKYTYQIHGKQSLVS